MAHENSLKNLMSVEELNARRTPEQRSEYARIAGTASGKSRNIRAREREEWIELLSLPMEEGDIDELKSIRGIKGANLPLSKQLKAVLVREALKGNLKAYELLLRCIGIDEPEPQETQQAQPGGFVDALSNMAAEVWGNEAAKKE